MVLVYYQDINDKIEEVTQELNNKYEDKYTSIKKIKKQYGINQYISSESYRMNEALRKNKIFRKYEKNEK